LCLKKVHDTAIMIKNSVLTLLLLVFLCCGPAIAQDAPQSETFEAATTQDLIQNPRRKFTTVSFENDSIGSGTDMNYTSGIRISHFDTQAKIPGFINQIAEKIPTFDVNETTSIFYSLGQNLYTPSDISRSDNVPGERPWAAWLYMSAGLTTVTKDHIDEIELTAGMVGPAALGEPVQRAVHKAINSQTPKGWDHQLKNEPGLMVSWNRRWPGALETQFGPFVTAFTPHGGATLGNIYSYGNVGATIYLAPSSGGIQDVPPRVRPAMPGTGFFSTPEDRFSWYLFAGVEGRAIARNIFLDGNSFRDGPSVDKKHLVADANAGLALTWDNIRVSYSLTYRTREFHGQESESVFGNISIGYRY